MKIKVYAIDFVFPRWLGRVLLYAGIPALLLVGGMAAAFDTSKIAAGNKLDPTVLKGNFDELYASLMALKARVDAPTISASAIQEAAMAGVAGTQVGVSVACPAGTKLISGGCSTDSSTSVLQAMFGSLVNWTCNYRNTGTAAGKITVQAYCLSL
jgi:hypothetical protein